MQKRKNSGWFFLQICKDGYALPCKNNTYVLGCNDTYCPDTCTQCEPGYACRGGQRYICQPGTYSNGIVGRYNTVKTQIHNGSKSTPVVMGRDSRPRTRCWHFSSRYCKDKQFWLVFSLFFSHLEIQALVFYFDSQTYIFVPYFWLKNIFYHTIKLT